jgi:hypothetical protein
MTYDNTNRIALFPNDKGNNAKRPDFRGTVNCAGASFKVSIWWRETKDGSGRKYLSGQVEPATEGDSRPADTPGVSAPPPAPQNAPNRDAQHIAQVLPNLGQQKPDEDVPF